MQYDRVSRILHWGFSWAILLQLLSEEFMKRPKIGRVRDDMQVFFFEMHEIVGMIALTLIVLRIFWGLTGNASTSWGKLFPYLTAGGCKGLVSDLTTVVPGWFKGKFPAPGEGGDYLAGTVHGLGLLLALAMGATGAAMFYGMDEHTGMMSDFVHSMKEVHEVLGPLLWVYVIGHVGMGIVHQLVGHNSVKQMFNLK